MTIEIAKLPQLLHAHVDTIFSSFGLILQKNPLRIVCQSFKHFRMLKSQLIELSIQFVELLSPSIIIQQSQLTHAVKAFAQLVNAKIQQNPVQITIPEKQFQTELLYVLHYIIFNQQQYAVLINQIPPDQVNELINQLLPIDQFYHLQKQLFIALVDKSEFLKKSKLISTFHSQKKYLSQSDFSIEISNSIICDFSSMKILRERYAFKSINSLGNKTYEIFLINENELKSAEFELKKITLACEGQADLEKALSFNALKSRTFGHSVQLEFASIDECQAVRKYWLVEGKEVME
ncbi:hypothetical protein SS50377_24896 [Spironucleus salmonicida]|uniref:Uncharacterized protein n=1 Tax=Spironucleus salmonicida TaxID=348837 RepID=V6LRL6_9EUKA|nr:hypothetical protein SS50377_24896 [Spironucleus salmonicida]|eukprot:EST43429.1 Hypothetical protein SS50377_16789 [Spironucleus salmonicida]